MVFVVVVFFCHFYSAEQLMLETSLLLLSCGANLALINWFEIITQCSPYQAVTGKIYRLKQQFFNCQQSLEGLLKLYKVVLKNTGQELPVTCGAKT